MPEDREGRSDWNQLSNRTRAAPERIRMQTAVARMAQTPTHFRFDLHRTRGGSILALKDMLGHSSLAMSLVYSHLAPSALARDVEKMKL